MPRVVWPLRGGRPCVEVVLTLLLGGTHYSRTLLADTGAGSRTAACELILDENDCVQCGSPLQSLTLRGAYSGSFPTYALPVQLPALGFDQFIVAVGVPTVPTGFDGIACFGFLNRFTYGSFGDHGGFGLEL